MANEPTVIPIFKVHTRKNEAKSKLAGRPIFDEMEVCEIRFAGNRDTLSVFPAHGFSRWQSVNGVSEPMTYAQRWPDQYRRFKEQRTQVQEGTPLDELPFLSQSKRLELKALSIYTAEALAALDGTPLKTLGMGGRDLKNQAQAYLDNAAGSADAVRQAAENHALREQLADLQRQMSEMAEVKAPQHKEVKVSVGPISLADLDDATLKALIKEATGSAPRGNPSHDTLVAMVTEIRDGEQVAA